MRWSEFANDKDAIGCPILLTKSYKILQIYSTIGLHFTLTEVCKGVLSRKQDLPLKKASPSVALSNCMAERDKSSL